MSTSTAKGYKGTGMDGWTAHWYAKTRRNDMEQFRESARRIAQRLRDGNSLLEIAPGPGFFALELAKFGNFRITGLDISRTMVEIARQNAAQAGVTADFQLGNAAAMSFGDASFDFVYCSAAFKNFTEPVKALNEMHRVLRPGGEAVIDDLCKDTPMEEIDRYVEKSGRGAIDGWLTKMAFRVMLLKRAYSRSDFEQMASQSRFARCTVSADGIGLEVRFVKERP
ncbi:MAG TPA: class I SAM-dependent methyltransferase [Candidatus Eisenbacteria bacterium]|nr:class I SAM-dependent methyltransferase [Candidatus Eisenbacteria bacterium]